VSITKGPYVTGQALSVTHTQPVTSIHLYFSD